MSNAHALDDYCPSFPLPSRKKASAVGRSTGRKQVIVMQTSGKRVQMMENGVTGTFALLAAGSLLLAVTTKGATRDLGIILLLLAVFMLIAFGRDK